MPRRNGRSNQPDDDGLPLSEGAPRKADRVARDLIARVATQEIAVGSLLPKEEELAASYGVTRGVLREAVKLLEVHRIVRPVRRRGTVVLDPLHSMSPEVLVAMLVPRPGHVDRKTLASFLELRAAMDVEMLGHAATRRTAADVQTLRAIVEQLADDLLDPRAFAKTLRRFPLAIARAAKSPVLEMLAAFNTRVVSELEAMSVATRPPSREHVDGLRMLVELIAQKDAEGARKIVATFHAWATPRILASAALASGAPAPDVSKPARSKRGNGSATEKRSR
ncbi:MAG: FadR family transcriptional regulator [Polyangiaceae bacterium]|nr:FadR family transcriptional regulator [Polyangiaceae bacterium]